MLPGEANTLATFPNLARWFAAIDARPAVARARAVAKDHAFKKEMDRRDPACAVPVQLSLNGEVSDPRRVCLRARRRSNGKTTSMIDLYYWPTPNGHKITIFLEEAGLEYRIRPIDISAGDQFQPAFLAFSPNNRMPAIIDNEPEDGANRSAYSSWERSFCT